MGVRLGANRYGKAENRVVRIVRDTARHEIRDLNVSTSLRGEFEAAHTHGDQSAVLPTDTQKNTAFAYAKRHGVTSIEDYALALGRRLLAATPAATGASVRVEEVGWDRIPVGPDGHDHAFVRRGDEVRTVEVEVTPGGVEIRSGLTDLVLLKSTGSEFRGFLRDEYTTLTDADDRVLATSLTATWTYASGVSGLDRLDHRGVGSGDGGVGSGDRGVGSGAEKRGPGTDWNASYAEVRAVLLEQFATTYSRALQETLWAMGRAVLERRPDIAEISFTAPNKHHHLVDLAPFGLDNPGEVFIAADRPYGLIEATVTRDET